MKKNTQEIEPWICSKCGAAAFVSPLLHVFFCAEYRSNVALVTASLEILPRSTKREHLFRLMRKKPGWANERLLEAQKDLCSPVSDASATQACDARPEERDRGTPTSTPGGRAA